MKTISNTFTVNTVIDGDDAAIAFATPAQISIPCYSNGNVKAQKITSVTFSLKVGTNTATVTSCAVGTKPTGVTVQGRANYAVTITVGTSATASGLSTGVTFTVTGTYGGKTYSATVTVALIGSTQGEQGDRGKVGRFFYYAGIFNASDTTTQFIVNDAQSPFFEYTKNNQKRYAVYNPENNPAGGSLTMSQMTPLSGGLPDLETTGTSWEIMTNDFKYLITEAIFADFAKLGSFVISGDWMLSTNGKINGTDYNDGAMYNGAPAYTWFDPAYPNVDHTKTVTIGGQQVTVHNFIPNFCVDGLTGETYQQNAHVTGEIRATGGTIGGFVISPTQISSNNNNIVLNSNGTATITGTINATNGSITGQMNIASGGSIIVGKEDSYRIKIAQSSNRGYITMLDGDSNNIILINYDTGKNAGQVKVSEADATHPRYTFINPNAIESMYNYKNANNQWNGDHSHITTQVGRRMAETEYDDLYVSGGLAARRHIKIGLGTTVSGSSEQSVVNLRAYNDNQESAWPVCNLDPDGARWMDKGHVHVMSMEDLKELLANPYNTYLNHLKNYAIMLTRIADN